MVLDGSAEDRAALHECMCPWDSVCVSPPAHSFLPKVLDTVASSPLPLEGGRSAQLQGIWSAPGLSCQLLKGLPSLGHSHVGFKLSLELLLWLGLAG